MANKLALKVVSLNMWQGGNLMEEALEFLKQEDAHIVLLQEVYNGTGADLAPKYRTMEVVRERLGYPYEDFAPAFLDNREEGKIEQGNAVLSKFKVADRSVAFLNEPYSDTYEERVENFPSCPRNVQRVTLDTPAGAVNVFNVQGVWDMDGDNYSERRQKMAEVILRMAKDRPNVILAGDTNAKPTNQAMVSLERELKSVFGNRLTSTFNMRRKTNPGYATAAVDLMFVSQNIEVLASQCPNIDVSDHLPLIVELAVNEKNEDATKESQNEVQHV